MLTVSPDATEVIAVAADLIIVPVFKGGIEGPGTGAVLTAMGMDAPPVTPSFRGDIGQTLIIATPGLASPGTMFVGLGRMDATDNARLRRAAATAARACGRARRVATTLAQLHPTDAAIQAVAEGFLLNRADPTFKSGRSKADGDRGAADSDRALDDVVILVPSSRIERARTAITTAAHYARASITARELVNLPPAAKRPPELAERLRRLLEPAGHVTVWGDDRLRQEGFGGLTGVGRGSASPPRLVEANHCPDDPLGHAVLVGKGITFDTGGLSLKRGSAMDTMKSDMAGAAAIAGAFSALADRSSRLEVTALLPLAENMPGSDAQRPGDVLRIHGGHTVEVTDTDAEGRLVMADALSYGATRTPDAIIDVATLTGDAIGALGPYAGALMATDDYLSAGLLEAADTAGEPLWRLPLWEELDPWMDSSVADSRNLAARSREGGAITAGLFLRRFVGSLPWAHLDIAGPAFLTSALPHHAAGGTGFGARTLLSWLEQGR